MSHLSHIPQPRMQSSPFLMTDGQTQMVDHLMTFWNTLLQKIGEFTSKEECEKWLSPLKATPIHSNLILVLVPNALVYQRLHDQFLPLFEQAKVELGVGDIFLQFELEASYNRQEQETEFSRDELAELQRAGADDTPEQVQNEADQNQTPSHSGFSRSLSTGSNLNPNYRFETFVKGPSNQFAMTTCQAVAMKPGQSYNPLFIFGSTGLGKTHLLHAVGNLVLKNNPNALVTYITSERFMNEMVYCLRHKKMWEFRQKYRSCDVFLVDDIQFISGKKTTQEEFFHTFNTLYAAKKQIVITSDLFPQDLPEIEERLRNRFQWGLIADIQPPDVEHRVAILMRKAQQINVQLPPDVAEYIARIKKRDIRELEGALSRLSAYSEFHGLPITLDLAHKTFKDVIGDIPKRLSIDGIQKVVADHYKIKISDLKSKRRQTAVAYPRQVAMYLSRKLTSASFPDIGEKFGGKDHTTVMHNVRKIEDTIATDLDLKATVESLERQIEQLH